MVQVNLFIVIISIIHGHRVSSPNRPMASIINQAKRMTRAPRPSPHLPLFVDFVHARTRANGHAFHTCRAGMSMVVPYTRSEDKRDRNRNRNR
ncbi:hypothetical protein GGS21DRAFT_89520 [Xylaria nigripes]|nr:hypothetical protein GGS21DRAFT_89520 [Xylaria nigripes]